MRPARWCPCVVTVRGRKVLAGLEHLCEQGVTVTVRGGPAAIGELQANGLMPTRRLTLRELSQQ